MRSRGKPIKPWDGIISEEEQAAYRAAGFGRDGRRVVAPLPEGIAGHFGPELRRLVLLQHHQGQVTVERVTAQLHAVGLRTSKRQMVRLLIDRQDGFLVESRDVLRAGLRTASWITVDDTGARHAGRNGFCTHMWTAPSSQGVFAVL